MRGYFQNITLKYKMKKEFCLFLHKKGVYHLFYNDMKCSELWGENALKYFFAYVDARKYFVALTINKKWDRIKVDWLLYLLNLPIFITEDKYLILNDIATTIRGNNDISIFADDFTFNNIKKYYELLQKEDFKDYDIEFTIRQLENTRTLNSIYIDKNE